MEHIVPTGALARYVAEVCVWPAVAAHVVRSVERLPDGSAGLVFRAAGSGRSEADLCATGPVSQAHYKRKSVPTLTVAVKFHAGGAYPFFGIPLHALADEIVPLEQLWGAQARRLEERLSGVSTGTELVRQLEAALLHRLEDAQDLELSSAVRVARAARKLASDPRVTGVRALAGRLGMSERQLRRAFSTAVGIGPKEYLRMLRFQRAAASVGRTGGQIAAAAGYYDQAHLISEFQHLARMTPRAFANRHARSTFPLEG